VKDVVEASVATGTLHCENIQWVFNNADGSPISARVRTDLARRGVGQVLAFFAKDDVLLD
jgi:hypothetical protein